MHIFIYLVNKVYVYTPNYSIRSVYSLNYEFKRNNLKIGSFFTENRLHLYYKYIAVTNMKGNYSCLC